MNLTNNCSYDKMVDKFYASRSGLNAVSKWNYLEKRFGCLDWGSISLSSTYDIALAFKIQLFISSENIKTGTRPLVMITSKYVVG